MNQIEQNAILNIVNEICDLHLNHTSTKNSISEFVIQDMIKIIHNMLKNGIHININWPLSINMQILMNIFKQIWKTLNTKH